MKIRFKAFIYRLSAVFGLRIYLAKKEEQEYINSMRDSDDFTEGLNRGAWQARNGFTTVWTWGMPWYKAFWTKLKHAFEFRSWK